MFCQEPTHELHKRKCVFLNIGSNFQSLPYERSACEPVSN